MRPRILPLVAATVLCGTGLAHGTPDVRPSELPFTSGFNLSNLRLGPDGGNRFVALRPGIYARLEGPDADGFKVVEYSVLNETRHVVLESGGRLRLIVARVVEEREWVDGELVEVARNYYAATPGGDVYQFGESVDEYEDGEIVGHDGSWLAGVDGAQPGLLMPRLYLLGARYNRSLAPGVSMDRAENIAMGETVATPAGTFDDCVILRETTELEPDEEVLAVYAPGVGLVVDEALKLVEYVN